VKEIVKPEGNSLPSMAFAPDANSPFLGALCGSGILNDIFRSQTEGRMKHKEASLRSRVDGLPYEQLMDGVVEQFESRKQYYGFNPFLDRDAVFFQAQVYGLEADDRHGFARNQMTVTK
jgi:hypothetical protein